MDVLATVGGGTNITFQCCSRLTPEEVSRIEAKKSPGFNILVATPLTFLKHFEGRQALLKQVEYVVLDECDKCFE